jgi:broad-specificity NMP kinase
VTALSDVLVLTGPAGSGKSTACAAVSGRVPGAVLIDGDTLASAKRPWDYDEYWDFTMRVCTDVRRNGLLPVICGIGLPSQVFPAADRALLRVDMLALVCDADVIRQRIVTRGYGEAWRDPEKHVTVGEALRGAVARAPHRYRMFDTGEHDAAVTAACVTDWVRAACLG